MSAVILSELDPPVKAILWDMDGLLADTEPLWTIAENEVCAGVGGVFTPELKARIVGTRLDTAIEILATDLRAQGCECDPAALGEALMVSMEGLFAGELSFMPGALALVEAAGAAGIPQALVSSSFRRLMDAVLRWLPAETFVLTIAGDEVTHAKPHPEPYLTAADRLGLDPASCLVLEDSPSGMRSGLAAGCRALMVPSVHGVAVEPGWQVVDSLVDVAP